MPEVRRTLLRLDTPEPVIADIIQALYSHLLERQNAPPGTLAVRRGYAGRGELKGWLCACAVHHAGRLNRRERRDVDLEQVPATVLPGQGKSPELALLTSEMKELFEAAFRDAVRALTSRERNPALPDVPTVIEAGIKGFEVVGFYGFLAPAGTPKDVVAKLSDAFKQVLAMPDVRNRMIAQGADPAFLGSDEFAKFLAAEMPRWAEAVKKSGARLD